jgi:hypothetical protein
LTTNQPESNLNTMTPNPNKPILNIDEQEQNTNWLRQPQTENWQTEQNENWLRKPKNTPPTKPNKRQRTAQNNNKTP